MRSAIQGDFMTLFVVANLDDHFCKLRDAPARKPMWISAPPRAAFSFSHTGLPAGPEGALT